MHLRNVNLHTVASTITPLKPLDSQLIGVSEPTLPEIATTKGSISSSNSLAENQEESQTESENTTAQIALLITT